MSNKFGDFIIDKKDFESGGYGHVYIATKEKEEGEKRLYVIKVPLQTKRTDEDKRLFNDEIDILNILTNIDNNTFTPILYGSNKFNLKKTEENEEKAYYAIDYFSNGLLFDYVAQSGLGEKLAKVIFKKLVLGLQFLHNNKICHLDIKPENIIFDDKFWPVYIDFGFSKIYKDENDQIILFNFNKGTDKYAYPELYDIKQINGEKADIFSLGAVLFNIVTGTYGFLSVQTDLYNLIKEKEYEDYWEIFKDKNLSDDFKDLYVQMVAYEPGDRPTIK